MYFYSYFNGLGVLDPTVSMNYAAKYYNLDLLKYGQSHYYVFSNTAMNNVLTRSATMYEIIANLWFSIIAAARGGHLYCLKYLYRQGCDGVDQAIGEAAHYGHMQCFKYLLATLPPANTLICSARGADYFKRAVVGGHLPIIDHMLNMVYY